MVVIQVEFRCVRRERGGQGGRGQATFTAVDHSLRTGTHVRTNSLTHRHHLSAQHREKNLQHKQITPHTSTNTHTHTAPQRARERETTC